MPFSLRVTLGVVIVGTLIGLTFGLIRVLDEIDEVLATTSPYGGYE